MSLVRELKPIVRGDTYTFTFKIRDKETDQLQTLTGGKVFCTLKKEYDDIDDDALILKEYVCSGTEQIIVFEPLETTIELGSYYIDVQFVKDGVVNTYWKQKIAVVWDVTRKIS